jgi:hypothetical protein
VSAEWAKSPVLSSLGVERGRHDLSCMVGVFGWRICFETPPVLLAAHSRYHTQARVAPRSAGRGGRSQSNVDASSSFAPDGGALSGTNGDVVRCKRVVTATPRAVFLEWLLAVRWLLKHSRSGDSARRVRPKPVFGLYWRSPTRFVPSEMRGGVHPFG